MAVVTVDTDLNQTVGVPYTVITDTSSDWPNVGNSIYFFDKEDKLVHYKNASGIVISTYSGGSNISISDLTFDGNHYIDLDGNEWDIKNGSNSLLKFDPYGNGGKISTNGSTVDSSFNVKWDGASNNVFTVTNGNAILHTLSIEDYRLITFDGTKTIFGINSQSGNSELFLSAASDGIPFFKVQKTGNSFLYRNFLVKGSDNSTSTSGFKVTDVNNLSLLDIKNDGVVTITRPASATTNSALMIDSSASGVGAGGIQINQGASNYGLTVFGDNNSIIHTFKNAAGINGMTIGSNSIEGYLLGVYNNGASLGGGMFLNSSFQSSGGSYGGIGLGYGTDIGVISGLDKDIIFYMTSTKLHSFKSTGEVVIGSTSSNTSAKLQVDSTTQGFAGPRMTTTERNAISTPLAGLEVYDTTLNSKMIYNGTSWDSLLPGGGGSGTKVLVKGAMGANQVVE